MFCYCIRLVSALLQNCEADMDCTLLISQYTTVHRGRELTLIELD